MAEHMDSNELSTPRMTVRQVKNRGHYDRQTVNAILDEALFCHVGIVEDDVPFVMPTIHVRVGDKLYLHGSPGSRLIKQLCNGQTACLSVTQLDGLVLARSAFHHSMNYRSVVILACGELVTDEREKQAVFAALVEHVVPGRSKDARMPTEKESRATALVSFPIEEASAKIRTGPPADEDEDYALPVWAGIIPLSLTPGAPIPDPRLAKGIDLPAYVSNYSRTNRTG